MGLEAIGSALSSVATSIGKASGGIATEATGAASVSGTAISVPTFEAAPAVGGLEAMFGPVMGPADIGPVINEGPVAPGFLENTMPLQLGSKPVEVINFQAPIKEGVVDKPETEGLIAEIEGFLSQARITPQSEQAVLVEGKAVAEPEPVKQATYWFVDVPESQRVVKPAEVIMPQVEPMAALWALPETQPALGMQPKLQPMTEARAFAQVAEDVAVQPALEEQKDETEEAVQEQVRVDEEEELAKERVIELKKYLVDQPVLATVLSEVDKAYDQAEEEAEESGLGRKVLGAMLAKLMPGQHSGNTGGAVKSHGIDGTIPARREAIAAIKEFKSKGEARAVVLKIRPVTIGENGQESKKEEVGTTFRDHVVKPPAVIRIVKERAVRREKAKSVVSSQAPMPVAFKQRIEANTEPTLKDLGLDRVFQKAALILQD